MDILQKLQQFYSQYKYNKGVIGYSYQGRPIYYFVVRRTPRPIIIAQYAIHGREYITTHLAIEQIKYFLKKGKVGSVYFIPMLNPDGVYIANYKNCLYKANARGVDLNVNFDARWGKGKLNERFSGSQNFIGKYPFSEKETLSIKNFTLNINPDMTVSYHSKGEEIYWRFFQDKQRLKRDYLLAKKVSKTTGYPLVDTPFSAGGYKDWCIQKLKIPAITIEVGNDKYSHPLGQDKLKEIFNKNKKVLGILTKTLYDGR